MTWKNENRDRWLNSFSWLWLLVFGGLGGYLIFSSDSVSSRPAVRPGLRGPVTPMSLVVNSPRGTAELPHDGLRDIEDIRVGMRVLGNNPDAREVDETLADPEPGQWRKLSLRMTKGNGDVLSIELLRPLEWLSFYEVAVGRTIDLDLSEMGAEGPAEVLAVEPCPPIQPGPGNVVTGTFAHRSSGDLINLHVAGEPRPIGVTRNHRYWSEDRREFVEVGDLRVGERLQAATGQTATVVAVRPRAADEPVYNLEVHQQHVYRVGLLGLLVHNNYGIESDDIVYRALRYDEIRGTFENGLFAKNLVARKSALQHVLEGSNPDFASQFISATRNRQLAEKWARKAGTAVAAIDLRRLDTSVSDLSNSAGRVRYLGDASRVLPGHDIHRANRLARGASELLIEQHVTREAIVGLKLFDQ